MDVAEGEGGRGGGGGEMVDVKAVWAWVEVV